MIDASRFHHNPDIILAGQLLNSLVKGFKVIFSMVEVSWSKNAFASFLEDAYS